MTAKDAIKRAQNDARISSAEVTKQREQCELAQILPSRDGTRCNQHEQARPQVKAAAPASATNLPWENTPSQQNANPAAGFIQYAEHRLAYLAPAAPLAATVPAGSPAVPSAPTAPPAANSALSGFPAEFLNPGQQTVLDCITAHPGLRVPKLSELTHIPAKSIERHISVLIDRNLIEHRGSKKTGGYYAK